MGVSSWLHASAALIPGEKIPIPAPAGSQTPSDPACNELLQ